LLIGRQHRWKPRFKEPGELSSGLAVYPNIGSRFDLCLGDFFMSNSTIRYVTTFLTLLVGAVALGQGAEPTALDNPELANARAMLQAGREQLIREDLQMTEAESAAFWPVYNKYRDEKRVVQDRHALMVANFVETHRRGGFNEEYADGLIKEHFEIRSAILEVQKRYVASFREVLSAVNVARFYQLENKMDAEIDAQLALVIPLAE